MCLEPMRPAACASRSKRRTASWFCATLPCRTLMATRRSMRVLWPSYTAPMPPSPRRRMIRYLPSMTSSADRAMLSRSLSYSQTPALQLVSRPQSVGLTVPDEQPQRVFESKQPLGQPNLPQMMGQSIWLGRTHAGLPSSFLQQSVCSPLATGHAVPSRGHCPPEEQTIRAFSTGEHSLAPGAHSTHSGWPGVSSRQIGVELSHVVESTQ